MSLFCIIYIEALQTILFNVRHVFMGIIAGLFLLICVGSGYDLFLEGKIGPAVTGLIIGVIPGLFIFFKKGHLLWSIISYGLATLFLLFFGGLSYEISLDGNIAFSLVLLIIGVMPGLHIFESRKSQNNGIEFECWIKINIKEIKEGTAIYCGQRINLNTKLVRYKARMGRRSLSSPWRLEGTDNGSKSLYTVVTMLAGWWSFPYGPIRSYRAIKKNFQGGQVTTISKVFDIEED